MKEVSAGARRMLSSEAIARSEVSGATVGGGQVRPERPALQLVRKARSPQPRRAVTDFAERRWKTATCWRRELPGLFARVATAYADDAGPPSASRYISSCVHAGDAGASNGGATAACRSPAS